MTPFGPYSLLRKIATGGTAEIYLARRHGVDGFARHLAIKRILPHLESEPAFIQLLLDEARIAAHLHHGHIIPIHEVGVEDGQAYIAMEYLPGTDLGRLMRAARQRKRRVLVVSREAGRREAVGRAVAAKLGAEVVAAAEVEQAYAYSAAGPLDLAFLDTRLLQPSRDPLLHELQAAHPELMRSVLMGPAPGRRAGCYAMATEVAEPAGVAELGYHCLRPRIPLELTVQIVRAVAEALDYAHQASDFAGRPLNVVHRDVNPSNILVSVGGVVKLVDFGIAKAAIRVRDEGRGNFVGTLNYMSPEQTRGLDADPRSDQFALGTVLWELLAGRHPFAGENEFLTMRNIQERVLPPLVDLVPGIPDALSELVARAMSKEPAERFPTMAALAEGIEEIARREGLNLSPKRLARYLEVIYTEAERAAFGLSATGYETPAPAPARPRLTPSPAPVVSGGRGGGGPRRAVAALEFDVDLDDLDELDDSENPYGDADGEADLTTGEAFQSGTLADDDFGTDPETPPPVGRDRTGRR